MSSFASRIPDGFPWLRGLKKPLQLGFAAAVVTAVFSLFMPNYYKSEARILPVSSSGSSSLGQLAAAAAAFGVSVPGQDGGDANYVDILKSRWLREQLIRAEYSFRERKWRFGSEALRRQTLFDYLEAKNIDRALGSIAGIVNASSDMKTKVLTISAETKSPELSQQLVRKATSLLETFVREKGRTRGGAKAAFTEARLKEAREDMTQAEDEFRKFLEGNRNYQISTEPSVRLHGSRIEAELNLRRQLVSALAMNYEQALLEEKNDMPLLNILDPGSVPDEKSRPKRSLLVIAAFCLVGLVVWVFENREMLKSRLLEESSLKQPGV